MGIGKIIKSLILGAAITIGSSYAINNTLQAETTKPVTKEASVEKADSAYLESEITTQDGVTSTNQFAALSSKKRPYFKVNFNDSPTRDSLKVGTSGRLNLDFFKGNAELIGYSDSEDNYGIGVNARGEFEGIASTGLSIERMVNSGNATNLFQIYGKRKFGDFEPNLSLTLIDDDSLADLNLNGSLGLVYTHARHMFGAGVTSDTDGEGFATFFAGMVPERNGEGFGYRLFGRTDFDGNYFVDLLGSTNSTISRGTIAAMVSPDNGVHDLGIVPNMFDAAFRLHDRTTPGGFAFNLRFGDSNGVMSGLADMVYQLPEFEGISPRIGIGYRVSHDGTDTTQTVIPSIGVMYKGVSLDATAKAGDGQKPEYTFLVSAGFDF